MGTLPSGTVTFLFTDIEGSTLLLQELGAAYAEALAEHRQILREAFARHCGVEVDTQGDAFFVAFARAQDAAAAAAEAQQALGDGPIRVRMGLHTGEPVVTEEGYVGLDVHRAARLSAAGHGGQVLLSQRTRELLDSTVELLDLGDHRLKDLAEPERLFQLGIGRFPPLKTISNTNLPVPATRLVGRNRELLELRGLLEGGDRRLVTLTGAGGSGKSRLAVAAGLDLLEEFPNGVFFVELAPVIEHALVPSTVAQVLGVRERPARPLLNALKEHLADRQTLLIVDNFEHLLEAAPLVSELVHAAPGLVVLVTSRERLRLSGEHEYQVSPLPEEDALALFLERAGAANAFELTIEDQAASSEICRRLDGLPLALELAAARVKALPPTTLLERLDQRLPLLTGGARDVPERQRTLRATIEWSHDLLEDDEQRLFAYLSLFVGGCTLEAAENVCKANLETLFSLVDKSLVREEHGPNGEPRFWMLETIREYAVERLQEEPDREKLRRRHAGHFADFARQLQPDLRNVDRPAIERIEAEHDNMRAALGWSLESGELDYALELVWNLKHFWIVRGYAVEGDEWARRALAASEHLSPIDRVWVLVGAADLAACTGDLDRSIDLKLASIDGLRALGEDDLVAGTFADLVCIAANQGDLDRGAQFEREATLLADRLQTARSRAFALFGRGYLALRASRFGDAREALIEAAHAWESQRSLGDVANCYLMVGECFRREGQLPEARDHLRRGLALARDIGAKFAYPEGLEEVAGFAMANGESAQAAVFLGASERARTEVDMRVEDPGDYERNLARARTSLVPDTFESMWNLGLGMSSEDAVVKALSYLDHVQSG
jgi:predicted ATPase